MNNHPLSYYLIPLRSNLFMVHSLLVEILAAFFRRFVPVRRIQAFHCSTEQSKFLPVEVAGCIWSRNGDGTFVILAFPQNACSKGIEMECKKVLWREEVLKTR
uniref:Uncharacterized protein n=1 Tax=Parascaris univalens TaxID=6257 RepID=A0A915A809_PARUN